MPIPERDFYRLEQRTEIIEKCIAKMDADFRELYGTVRELHGLVEAMQDSTHILQRLDSIQKEITDQRGCIGQLTEAITTIKAALAHSSDRAVAGIASGVVINLDASQYSRADNTHNISGVDTANVNTGPGTIDHTSTK